MYIVGPLPAAAIPVRCAWIRAAARRPDLQRGQSRRESRREEQRRKQLAHEIDARKLVPPAAPWWLHSSRRMRKRKQLPLRVEGPDDARDGPLTSVYRSGGHFMPIG